jgi:hypothetical protein
VSKQAALESFQKLVGQSARFLETLYDVAGMEAESDRIRRSSHRVASETPPETTELPEQNAPEPTEPVIEATLSQSSSAPAADAVSA